MYDVYKVTNGTELDFVSAASTAQAEASARAIWPGKNVQVVLATPEEANILMRSHSYPMGDE